MQRHRPALLLVPILAAAILAIYPYLLYHVPFSTDSWPQISSSQQILDHTPAAFTNSSLFGSYVIFWPAESIFGSIASLLFNSPPIQSSPLLLPILAAVQVIVFFVIVEELTKNSLIASISSLIFATASFHDLFAAAMTKETYANPIFMICMLVLLKKSSWKTITLFGISLLALNLSEHATTLFLLGAAGSIILVTSILGKKNGGKLGAKPLLPVIGIAITAAYFILYADQSSFQISQFLNEQTIIIALSFLALVLSPVIYYTLSRPRRILPIEESIIFGVVVAAVIFSTRTSVISLAPVIPLGLLSFILPYLAVGFFALVGYRFMQARMSRASFAYVGAWTACAVGLTSFAAFSGVPEGIFLVYRMFEYLYAPIAILAGITLWKASTLKVSGTGIAKFLTIAIIVVITLATSYQTYAIASEQGSIFGAHWVYKESDISAAEWTKSAITETNVSLSGDSHVQYLFRDYLQMNVSLLQGYEYLIGKARQEGILVTYSLMQKNGYVLYLSGEPLPSNWMTKLENDSSLVYSNGNVMVWG